MIISVPRIGLNLCTSLVVLLLISGCNKQIAVKPDQANSRLLIEPEDSSLSLQIKIPYATISDIVNQQGSELFSDSGAGPESCRQILGVERCLRTQYDYRVKKTSDFSVSRINDETLRLSMSLAADGIIGLQGETARILGLDEREIAGALLAVADLSLDIDDNWCPSVSGLLNYQWLQEPRLEVIGGFQVNITSLVESGISPHLQQALATINDSIPCSELHQYLSSFWQNYSVALDIPRTEQLVYLNFSPTEFGSSNLLVNSDNVSIVTKLKGQSAISGAPLQTELETPLPNRSQLSNVLEQMNIQLPVRVDYQTIQRSVLDAFGSQSIPFQYLGKTANFNIQHIEIYPSGTKLTVGIQFEVDNSGRFSDTAGWLYLSGTPSVDQVQKKLFLADVEFSQFIDNRLWSTLATLLQGTVKSTVEQATKMELQPQIDQLQTELEKAISDPDNTGGLKLSVQEFDLELLSVVPESQSLAALVKISAFVEAEVTTALLR